MCAGKPKKKIVVKNFIFHVTSIIIILCGILWNVATYTIHRTLCRYPSRHHVPNGFICYSRSSHLSLSLSSQLCEREIHYLLLMCYHQYHAKTLLDMHVRRYTGQVRSVFLQDFTWLIQPCNVYAPRSTTKEHGYFKLANSIYL